jgi:uncharacterized protein (TIGR04141 family)
VAPAKPASQHLTVFLLKSGIDEPESALRNAETLKVQSITAGGSDLGVLYVEASKPRPPKWLRFFQGQAKAGELGLKTASSKAVFLVPIDDRTFDLAFGFGRHLLKPEAIQDGFGLRTTLNVIRPDGIRGLDRQSFDTLTRHTREQASRDGQLGQFQIDPEQDLLRALVGVPSDTDLGTRLSGADALSLVVPVQLGDLREFLRKVLDHHDSDAYQDNFSWVDHLKDVKDPNLRGQLESTLISRLKAGDLERTWLAPPDVLEWEKIDGFRYSKSKKKPKYDDLHLAELLGSVTDAEKLSIKFLKDHRVHCISALTDESILDWQVFQCLYAEIDVGTSTFLLSGGKWYCVTQDFVETVNEQLAGIQDAEVDLPLFLKTDKEASYLVRVAQQNPMTMCLMDQKNIYYGGGYSQVEFCDLFTSANQLIHVKRWYQSAGLSHLFMQARVSALLFHTAADFREKVNEKLAASHKLANPSEKPNPSDFEIVLAIVSRSEDPIRTALPFFSRIAAVNTARELRGYGYRVSLRKIATEQ